MSLFDMFKKKTVEVAKPSAVHIDAVPTAVYATAAGEGMAMADIPDPVFASGAMGKAYGIKPSEGVVYAPVNGTVTVVAQTLHALGISSDDGVEVLIHIGVDTVTMKGDGFTSFVEKGQHIVAGEPLLTFDREKIAAAGFSDVVITVITNGDDLKDVEPVAPKTVAAGDKIFDIAFAE